MAKKFTVDTDGTLTTNLVSYYKLEDVNDFWASYNLTNNNAATFGAGKINNAVNVVRASSQYLSIASSLSWNGGVYSIAGWFNPSSQPASGQYYTIGAVSEAVTDTILGLAYYNDAGTYKIYASRTKYGVADQGVFEAQTLNTGTWYHLVITYDGTNVRAYVNGTLLGSPGAASGNGNDGANNRSEIGTGAADNLTHLADGSIDEVGFWNKALSAQEMTDLYNGGAGQTMCTVGVDCPSAGRRLFIISFLESLMSLLNRLI